jgi:hypothetical protein
MVNVVLVEQEEITGSLNVHQQAAVPRRQISQTGSRYEREPSLSDRHAPAKLYAHYLRGMKPVPNATDLPTQKTDSVRTRTMEDSQSLDSSALGLDAR